MRHEVHGELLMIVAVVVASRKTNQYRCRVCFTLAEDGRVLTWLPPPFSQCACVIYRYVCAHQLALVCMLSFIAVLVARVRSGANAPVAEGDDVDVDVDVDVDQKEDVDAAAAAAAAVGVGGGGAAAAGGGGAGAAPTGAITLADVVLLLPDPVMPLSQLPILLRYLFSPVVSRKFATLKKKMEIVTHADCSSSGGGGGGSSSNSSSGDGGGGNGSNNSSNSSNSHINSSGGGGGGSGSNSSSSGGGSGSTSSISNISSGRGGGGGSSNSNINSSNNNNNTGAAAATAADDDDGGGGGRGDDDDGDYSEEEDIDEFIDWALAVDAEEAERAALEAYHSNFGGGYSGGDRASASVLYSRVVDGAGTRSEPIAMLAEIATWTYSPAPPRASVDSVVEHTGFVTAASIRAATADDLALKANTATVRLRGYQREGTECQFHACFCDQILHAVGRNLLQCDTILTHYVVMVREEVDAALAAWTGLPAQQASPPNPTGLAWAELEAVLPGRWLVLGAPRLGVACEAVSVSAVVDGSATGTYTDRGATGTFKLTVAVSGHGSTYLVSSSFARRWMLALAQCVWARDTDSISWVRETTTAATSPAAPRARRASTQEATARAAVDATADIGSGTPRARRTSSASSATCICAQCPPTEAVVRFSGKKLAGSTGPRGQASHELRAARYRAVGAEFFPTGGALFKFVVSHRHFDRRLLVAGVAGQSPSVPAWLPANAFDQCMGRYPQLDEWYTHSGEQGGLVLPRGAARPRLTTGKRKTDSRSGSSSSRGNYGGSGGTSVASSSSNTSTSTSSRGGGAARRLRLSPAASNSSSTTTTSTSTSSTSVGGGGGSNSNSNSSSSSSAAARTQCQLLLPLALTSSSTKSSV